MKEKNEEEFNLPIVDEDGLHNLSELIVNHVTEVVEKKGNIRRSVFRIRSLIKAYIEQNHGKDGFIKDVEHLIDGSNLYQTKDFRMVQTASIVLGKTRDSDLFNMVLKNRYGNTGVIISKSEYQEFKQNKEVSEHPVIKFMKRFFKDKTNN